MKTELEAALFKDFPNLYNNHYRCFETNDGWEPLLREFSANAEPLIASFSEASILEFKVFCIKEKFGALRIQIDIPSEPNANDEVIISKLFDLIQEAEKKSESICEFCANPGKLTQTKHLLQTFCQDCKKIK